MTIFLGEEGQLIFVTDAVYFFSLGIHIRVLGEVHSKGKILAVHEMNMK